MTDGDARLKVIAEYLASPLSRLLSASERGNLAAVKAAIDEGVSIADRDPLYGSTALHLASDGGSKKVAEYLIASGAALDALDNNMMTPLMCACSTGKKKGSEVALLLMSKGADACYVRVEDGMDAIKFALWGRCTNEVISRLLELGAAQPASNFRVVHLD